MSGPVANSVCLRLSFRSSMKQYYVEFTHQNHLHQTILMSICYINFHDKISIFKKYQIFVFGSYRKNCLRTQKLVRTRAGVCKTLCPQLPDTNTA